MVGISQSWGRRESEVNLMILQELKQICWGGWNNNFAVVVPKGAFDAPIYIYDMI